MIELIFRTLRRGCGYIRRHYFPTPKDKVINLFDNENGQLKTVEFAELDDTSIILEVGGFLGDFTAEMSARYNCSIFVFEPVPAFAERLRGRFAKNKKINIQEIGLGSMTSKQTMVSDGDASSLYGEKKERVEISIVDVVEWFDLNKIEKVSLMSINIEGGEYLLLDRLIESGYINKIDNVQVQFHDIYQKDAESRMIKIQKELAQTHYLTYQYKFVWENWRKKTTE